MIVKHSNHISITHTAKVTAQEWVSNHGPAICDKIDRFFVTQAGSR